MKSFDLVSSPVFMMVPAKDKYEKPTKKVNELWQTDFTQLKVQGWGWYYLSTVLDDYSRYILAWKLSKTMGTISDFKQVMELVFNGRLKPVIDCSFPLEGAAEAHKRLEMGKQMGKITLEI